jgi:hypothetical protein
MRKKQRKKKHSVITLLGSLALAAGAAVLMPIVIDRLSELLYAPAQPAPLLDDWGPEIVKNR